MFNSTDLEQLDLSNVYPTDDLIEIAQAHHRSNYSIDNLYSTSTYYLENTNLTLKERIAIEIYERNGPVRDELGTALSLTIIYSLILFTGVIGNLATCIVIVRNKYMHTSVNYYLFSLACSDLLLLILGLPQEMYMLWQRYPYIFGEQFCILRAFTSETSTNASILTITAFTIERYLAICHPLKVQTMSQLSRAIKAILIIWAIAGIASIPTAAQLGIVLQTLNTTGEILPQTAQCVIKNPLQNSFEISAIVFFILPMVVISCLYVLIGLALRRSSSISNTNSSASHYHSPHHSCNQTNLNTKTNQQRNSNSIVLDNNSSPTTLIYNDKSVTFYTGLDKQQNRKNSILNSTENIDLKQPLMDKRQHKLNLDNFVNKENQFNKDKDNLSNRTSPTLKQQFNNQLKPSFEEEELIELNNNNQNFNKPSSLFLNINNGSSLTAHRSSDLLTATAATTNINNSTSINSITNNNLNQNSILTPTTQAVTISATGNSIHHRHHSQATSRRSVIKMLVAVVVSFFICWSPFHLQRIMASHIGRDSNELLILIYRLLTYVSAITYYLTATINPMLYQICSIKFRLAFKETFGFWVLRPKKNSGHHSSIGNTAVGPIAAQQTTLNQTSNQTTTAITYDQPSNNQTTTIYNFESSNTVASNMSNSNSLQNGLQTNLKNSFQNSLKNGFQNGSKTNCSQNGSQKNVSSIPNSNSGNNLKKNNSQTNIIIENALTNSTTNGDNSLKERSNKIIDQPSIHLDVNSTWINKIENEKSQTESNEKSSIPFKQQQNKIINCNSTLNGSNSTNNLNNDLSKQNDNLKDNSIIPV